MIKAPGLVKWTKKDTIDVLNADRPFHVPEWNASIEKGPGRALLEIFLAMTDAIGQRLNEAPDKSFIDFLDRLGAKLIPARPARGPVTFMVSEGTAQSILIPAGSQVSVGEVVFETETAFMATPSKLAAVFSVKDDVIVAAPQNISEAKVLPPSTINTSFTVFEGADLQEHAIYLGHSDLLNVLVGAKILLEPIGSDGSLPDPQLTDLFQTGNGLTWEYFGTNAEGILGWYGLTREAKNGRLLSVPGDQGSKTEISLHEVEGRTSRWIRCRCREPYLFSGARVSKIGLRLQSRPLTPDLAVQNNVPLDLNKESLLPFGPVPRLYDTFYVASREAFSKKGAGITLSVALETGDPSGMLIEDVYGIGKTFAKRLNACGILTIGDLVNRSDKDVAEILGLGKPLYRRRVEKIMEAARRKYLDSSKKKKPFPTPVVLENPPPPPELSWEYWNGRGWMVIQGVEDDTNAFTYPQVGTITFTCPGDIEPTKVGGQENYWIRVRIVGGDYGKEIEFGEPGGEFKPQLGTVRPPRITSLKIDQKMSFAMDPEVCLTYNNLEFKDVTGLAGGWKPFEAAGGMRKELFFGFDKKIEKGPISLYLDIEERDDQAEDSRGKWAYSSGSGDRATWERLEIVDQTRNLRQSGTLACVFPDDFAPRRMFGRDLYWIRRTWGTAEAAGSLKNPVIKGIFLNTTLSTQHETIQDELLGSGTGVASQTFFFSRTPSFDEEVWVDEFSTLSEAGRNALAGSGRFKIDEIKDEKGGTTEFWVRWQPVEDLFFSGTDDRDYEVDPVAGFIRFGDGAHGRMAPLGRDNVKATYKTGGGAAGNVAASEINTLKTSIAFLDGVTNPLAASGGAEAELIESALVRGSGKIKVRNRAVSAEDYEQLAKEASTGIARVKCLPNFAPGWKPQCGWVTVIVVPNDAGPAPLPNLQLKGQVETYLLSRAPGAVVVPGRLHIAAPVYATVSVSAVLAARSMDLIPLIEKDAERALETFLHPLKGGDEARGWEFGRVPHYSDFCALLEKIAGVDHVRDLAVSLKFQADESNVQEWSLDAGESPEMEIPSFVMICSGAHDITAVIGEEQAAKNATAATAKGRVRGAPLDAMAVKRMLMNLKERQGLVSRAPSTRR